MPFPVFHIFAVVIEQAKLGTVSDVAEQYVVLSYQIKNMGWGGGTNPFSSNKTEW